MTTGQFLWDPFSFIYSHTVHYYRLINTRWAFSKCWSCLNKCSTQKKDKEVGRGGQAGLQSFSAAWKLRAQWIALPTLQETDKVFCLEALDLGVVYAAGKRETLSANHKKMKRRENKYLVETLHSSFIFLLDKGLKGRKVWLQHVHLVEVKAPALQPVCFLPPPCSGRSFPHASPPLSPPKVSSQPERMKCLPIVLPNYYVLNISITKIPLDFSSIHSVRGLLSPL